MTTIYHYTSLDAAVKIIKNDNICFWGTRYDSMNDPTDSIYARDIVLPLFRKCVEESNLNDYEKDDSEAFPYIVSFSKNDDDFNMWRMYKADIALEFDYDKIKEVIDNSQNYIYFEECEYAQSEDDIHHFFTNKLNSVNNGQGIMLAARHALAFIKRKEFESEHEVRLVDFDHESDFFRNGEFTTHENPQNIGIKTIRDKDIVLYKEFLLPKDALTGIIINSNGNEHFERLKHHIKLVLLQLKYDIQNINIRKSRTGDYINLNV